MMRTPLNQQGQAVQIHGYNESSNVTSRPISDVAFAGIDVNSDTGKIIQVTSNINFMIRFTEHLVVDVNDTNAIMFLAANVPYYIKVPGAKLGWIWYMQIKGTTPGVAGRVVVMEIETV